MPKKTLCTVKRGSILWEANHDIEWTSYFREYFFPFYRNEDIFDIFSSAEVVDLRGTNPPNKNKPPNTVSNGEKNTARLVLGVGDPLRQKQKTLTETHINMVPGHTRKKTHDSWSQKSKLQFHWDFYVYLIQCYQQPLFIYMTMPPTPHHADVNLTTKELPWEIWSDWSGGMKFLGYAIMTSYFFIRIQSTWQNS